MYLFNLEVVLYSNTFKILFSIILDKSGLLLSRMKYNLKSINNAFKLIQISIDFRVLFQTILRWTHQLPLFEKQIRSWLTNHKSNCRTFINNLKEAKPKLIQIFIRRNQRLIWSSTFAVVRQAVSTAGRSTTSFTVKYTIVRTLVFLCRQLQRKL